jgi:hypothetical protein
MIAAFTAAILKRGSDMPWIIGVLIAVFGISYVWNLLRMMRVFTALTVDDDFATTSLLAGSFINTTCV